MKKNREIVTNYRRSFAAEDLLIADKNVDALRLLYQRSLGDRPLYKATQLLNVAFDAMTGYQGGHLDFGSIELEDPARSKELSIDDDDVKDFIFLSNLSNDVGSAINEQEQLGIHLGARPSLGNLTTSLGRAASHIAEHDMASDYPYITGATYNELAIVSQRFGFNLAPVISTPVFKQQLTIEHKIFQVLNGIENRPMAVTGLYMATSEFVERFAPATALN